MQWVSLVYIAWPVMPQAVAEDADAGQVASAVDCYFMCQVCNLRLRHGHLLCMPDTMLWSSSYGSDLAPTAVHCIMQDGSMFKARVLFEPYFYIQVKVSRGHTRVCGCASAHT